MPCRVCAHGATRDSRAFSFTAALMSALSALPLILSPSRKSMARLALSSRLELNKPEGSSRSAPLANVIFTAFLYVSPVQTIPLCDQTGTPTIPFDGFLHFRSSMISGSACLISARIRESMSPRQSPGSLIVTSLPLLSSSGGHRLDGHRPAIVQCQPTSGDAVDEPEPDNHQREPGDQDTQAERADDEQHA